MNGAQNELATDNNSHEKSLLSEETHISLNEHISPYFCKNQAEMILSIGNAIESWIIYLSIYSW